MFARSDSPAPAPQGGFTANQSSAKRARSQAIAASALLGAIFLAMSAFVIARAFSGG